MVFGQLVIGPPGSGKTTYCHGMQQYLLALGRRVALVNLDPANDVLPYTPDVDVADLVCLDTVMEELHLGPNGGMLYCMEYLAANLDWLKEKLQPLEDSNTYLLIDCPGQVELFTQHEGFKQLLAALAGQQQGGWGYRLTAVHLVDAHLATDASKYISALLLSLSTMLHMELPHGPFSARHRKLSKALCGLVEGYGLVGFTPLAIQDRASVARLLALVDKANGAVYAKLDAPPVGAPAELLVGAAHSAVDDELAANLQDRYIDAEGEHVDAGASAAKSPGGGLDGSSKPVPQANLVAGSVLERIPEQPGVLPPG
ncbi:cytoplasmic protein [Scenedesmus sp. NREL 46B-D3]|nr:cytoplasmic protein [Scenedesmus sp. NREL 46B-D3]